MKWASAFTLHATSRFCHISRNKPPRFHIAWIELVLAQRNTGPQKSNAQPNHCTSKPSQGPSDAPKNLSPRSHEKLTSNAVLISWSEQKVSSPNTDPAYFWTASARRRLLHEHFGPFIPVGLQLLCQQPNPSETTSLPSGLVLNHPRTCWLLEIATLLCADLQQYGIHIETAYG